jgi:hypothetical protein
MPNLNMRLLDSLEGALTLVKYQLTAMHGVFKIILSFVSSGYYSTPLPPLTVNRVPLANPTP